MLSKNSSEISEKAFREMCWCEVADHLILTAVRPICKYLIDKDTQQKESHFVSHEHMSGLVQSNNFPDL